ncbi:hypothetical protein H0I23_01745 [Cellulophaga sp. HaHaR_3_176]|uniref:hypothetical protein n=1 Tax=Cellulophaga sp. HaHaR_3_176 TaxID=1942464 RepID=UPI001C1FC29C|nr:hypothetical protein [Cellulophaga sp. HaHaR_3_176]QWX84400.1 hypothetical protein H0I23_01745 [Cellulophaga sp. HaHaR_3_176]
MKRNIFLIAFMLFLITFKINAQSGWTREAKGFYGQLTASTFSSHNYYTTTGSLSDEGSTFNTHNISLYGEYGITDRLTTILDVPAVVLNSFSTTETVAGIGSVKLGFKYRIFKETPIAIQVDLDIPTNDGVNFATAKQPDDFGQINTINLPTSDGEFNIWTNLIASHSFPNGKTYGSIYSGVNFRTESFSNQIQAGAELGHLFLDKFYLIGKLKIQEKLSSGSDNNQNSSFLYGEGTTFTSFGFNGVYKFNEKYSLVAAYSDYTDILVNRKNIYDGATFSLGLAVEF